jgi:hypothetical protein
MKHLGLYDVGSDEPIDVELYVNYPVVFDKRKKNKKNQELLKPYNVEGHWDEELYAIRIIVNIDSQADLSMMYDLIGELNETLTHELVHIHQHENDYDFPDDEDLTPLEYYTQDHEIEAQYRGFKRRAKKEYRTIENVMDEWFDKNKNLHRLTPDEVEIVKEKILDLY